ncbi:MAG: prepilin peptidase [Oscillospiraceae bacterium]|nr:prepilin peptidase [Oscillospiraceae bacterium]
MLHNEFMSPVFYILFYPIVFFYGICIGSFLNVVIFRLPKNESLIKRSSHCMTCGEKIRIRDLVPIFSWLFLKGKCRKCGEKISPRYPIVEALNGIVYIITFTVLDFNVHSILCCIFFSVLICIGFMDWDTMEIDPWLLLIIALLAVPDFFFYKEITLVSRLIGLVCISVPFFLIGEISGAVIKKRTGEKVRGIELGDTVLMAACGLMIGWKAVVASAFFGIAIAAVVGLINKFRSGESKFAFGPYLAIGLFFGTLFGDMLVDWYIGLLTYDPYAQVQ